MRSNAYSTAYSKCFHHTPCSPIRKGCDRQFERHHLRRAKAPTAHPTVTSVRSPRVLGCEGRELSIAAILRRGPPKPGNSAAADGGRGHAGPGIPCPTAPVSQLMTSWTPRSVGSVHSV
jgi:hypothetical protein